MSGRVVPAAGSGAEGPSRVATASEASTVAAMSVRVSREEAWSLLSDWVASESLRRHCLCVEAAMRAYARREGADEELWGVTGLLHDADYERFPDMDDTVAGHPRTIIAELERRDAPPDMVRAIASHADFLGVSRDTPMERTLHAVDELSGFLVACAVVRPAGIQGLTPKSVQEEAQGQVVRGRGGSRGRPHERRGARPRVRRARHVRHRGDRGARRRAGARRHAAPTA